MTHTCRQCSPSFVTMIGAVRSTPSILIMVVDQLHWHRCASSASTQMYRTVNSADLYGWHRPQQRRRADMCRYKSVYSRSREATGVATNAPVTHGQSSVLIIVGQCLLVGIEYVNCGVICMKWSHGHFYSLAWYNNRGYQNLHWPFLLQLFNYPSMTTCSPDKKKSDNQTVNNNRGCFGTLSHPTVPEWTLVLDLILHRPSITQRSAGNVIRRRN